MRALIAAIVAVLVLALPAKSSANVISWWCSLIDYSITEVNKSMGDVIERQMRGDFSDPAWYVEYLDRHGEDLQQMWQSDCQQDSVN